jgi:hypothetical protein
VCRAGRLLCPKEGWSGLASHSGRVGSERRVWPMLLVPDTGGASAGEILPTFSCSTPLYAGMRPRQDTVWCRRMRRSPQLPCRNHFFRQEGIRRNQRGGCHAKGRFRTTQNCDRRAPIIIFPFQQRARRARVRHDRATMGGCAGKIGRRSRDRRHNSDRECPGDY